MTKTFTGTTTNIAQPPLQVQSKHPALFLNSTFNIELDINYLEQFYLGDYEYLSYAFFIFRTHSLNSAYHLLQYGHNCDWIGFKKLLHKLKPGFEIVGFTSVSNYFEELEKVDFSLLDERERETILNFLKQSFETCFSIISVEHRKLNFYLKS